MGGTVNGGTVEATAGNALVGTANEGTLIGVTLDASGGNASPLDMRDQFVGRVVSGGLTLSGVTLFLGNATGTTFGQLLFATGAAETIDGASGHPGTITFGLSGSNGLFNEGLTGTLTLGANLTINGTTGQISTSAQAFDNKGTITADPTILGTAAGTITLSGTNWTNDGTIQAKNGDNLTLNGTASSSPATHAWTNDAGHTIAISGGGTLTLDSTAATTADNTAWLNLGTITSNASIVDLGGFFTFAGLGTFNRTGRDGQPDRHAEQHGDHAAAEQHDGLLEPGGRDSQRRDGRGHGGQCPRGHHQRGHPDRGDARRQRRQCQPARHADQFVRRVRVWRIDAQWRDPLPGQCHRHHVRSAALRHRCRGDHRRRQRPPGHHHLRPQRHQRPV